MEQPLQLGLDRRDLGGEPISIVMLMLEGAPGSEHSAGELEALLADDVLLGQPF